MLLFSGISPQNIIICIYNLEGEGPTKACKCFPSGTTMTKSMENFILFKDLCPWDMNLRLEEILRIPAQQVDNSLNQF